MRVRLVRRPGQPGTRAYAEQYGDRLVCVRYRYDEAARRRYKTVEIIVEEAEWAPAARGVGRRAPEEAQGGADAAPGGAAAEPGLGPPRPSTHTSIPRREYRPAELVGVRLPAELLHLSPAISAAGGVRRELLDIWAMPFASAAALGLHPYIVDTVEKLAAAWNRGSTDRLRP